MDETAEITEEQRKRAAINLAAALAKRRALLSHPPEENRPWKFIKCDKFLLPGTQQCRVNQIVVNPSDNLEKFIARLEICSLDSFCITPLALEGSVFPGERVCLEKLALHLSNVSFLDYTQVAGGGRACVYRLDDYNLVLKSLKSCPGIECEEIPWGTYAVIERLSHSLLEGKWMPCRPEHLSDEIVDDLISRIPKNLLNSLLPFQLDGVRFGLRRGGRCLIADEMGLGKTLQAIAIASCFMDEGSLLIVCPAILRHSWADELERWLPFCLPSDIHLVFGHLDNPTRLPKLPKVVVISYAMLRRLQGKISGQEWNTLIVDESHHLHCNTKSTENEELNSVVNVAMKVKHLILLSGTPSLSRPFDIFHQVNMLWPGLLGKTKYDFAKMYCTVKLGSQGKLYQDFSEGKRLEELNVLLKESIMIRRLKVDVLPELPPKHRQIIKLVLKKSHISFAMVTLGLENVDVSADDGTENANLPTSDEDLESDMNKKLQKKLSALGLAKLPGFLEWLSLHPITTEMDPGETTEASSGSHKMLVFAYHHKVLDGVQEFLCEKGMEFVRVDCTVTGIDRELAIQTFQTSKKVKIALVGIRAGGSGLNLTAAENVVFLELPMRLADIQQAEDRAHRHGQKRLVNVYVFCAKDTTDEMLWQKLNKSLLCVSSTLNGKRDAMHEIYVQSITCFDPSTTNHKQKEFMKSHCCSDNSTSKILRVSHIAHNKMNEANAEQSVGKMTQGGNGCATEFDYGKNRPLPIPSNTLRFEVSKHTGRIHLYSCIPGIDARPRPLNVNLRPEEIECLRVAGGDHKFMDTPLHREALLIFIDEWKKLRPVMRRKLMNKPLQLPLTSELCYLSERHNHDDGGLLRGGSKRRITSRNEISQPLPKNAVWRKVNLSGGCNRKEKLYSQGWSEIDGPLCKTCQTPCKGNNASMPEFFEDLFCCFECFEEYRSRTSSGFIRQELFKIERGICTNCHLDCHRLASHLQRLSIEKRGEYVKKTAPNIAKHGRLLNKLVDDPTEGNAWHADHIVPVYKGGGECNLENIRTLCVACHFDVTSMQSKDRCMARKNARKRLKDAMASVSNVNKCGELNSVLKDFEFNIQKDDPGYNLSIDVPGSAYSRGGGTLEMTNEELVDKRLTVGMWKFGIMWKQKRWPYIGKR